MGNFNTPVVLDCTLRDGGYYNAWDFPVVLINDYLIAMNALGVDVVELGYRFIKNIGFKGACAFSTDSFLRTLNIPSELNISVMINASDLRDSSHDLHVLLEQLFPETACTSPVDIVRIATHIDDINFALNASIWLSNRGFIVGVNLMQISECSESAIIAFARMFSHSSVEVLYFADSMGCMKTKDIVRVVNLLQVDWKGSLGVHAHDNMGCALANTLKSKEIGVTWLDATVTGMGRGAGNARMEELVIETKGSQIKKAGLIPLIRLIQEYFLPMKSKHAWGSNPYYYLTGKYRIHPTYVQEMLADRRYNDEDILTVINQLRNSGEKKFSFGSLDAARYFYNGEIQGAWDPSKLMKGRDVLILGSGHGVKNHKIGIESFIHKNKPIVMALNTQQHIESSFIDLFVASNPVRLLADMDTHQRLVQPLVVPFSMIPECG